MTAFDLIKMIIPQFYLDVKEMMEVYESDGKLLDRLCEDVEAVKLNQFVLSADETIVKRLEKFFNFSVETNKSFNERKNYIVSYLSGFGKMDKEKVAGIIKQFTEAGSDMSLDIFNENNDQALFIAIDRGIKEGVSWLQLMETLADRLPAHLALKCSLKYSNGSFTADGYSYAEMAQFTHEELSNFIVPIEEVM